MKSRTIWSTIFFGILYNIFLQTYSWGAEVVPGNTLYPSVQKKNGDFYVAKMEMNSQPLYFAAERINESNIKNWKQYICTQNTQMNLDEIHEFFPTAKHSPQTGAGAALDVLTVNLPNREIWIAYVMTKEPNPIPDMTGYQPILPGKNTEEMSQKTIEFAKNVVMSVTITSTPGALITTHLGISGSFETLTSRPKGISLHLHAFAAQFMLNQNPQRKYMINCPVQSMLQIMLENDRLNGAMFVGNRGSGEQIMWRNYFALIANNESRIAVDESRSIKKNSSYKFLEEQDGNMCVSQAKIDKEVQRISSLVKKHPPLLKISEDGSMTIYDGQNPENAWLKIEKSDEAYGWLFNDPYTQLGGSNTPYVVTDLRALASCGTFQ